MARMSSIVELLDLRAPRARCGSRRRSAGTECALPAWPPGRSARSPWLPARELDASMREAGRARTAITSLWSPKIDSACVASVRAGDVEDRRRQLAGDLVHVGDHQQQALRRREGRRQRAGLQRAVHARRRRRLRSASRRPWGWCPRCSVFPWRTTRPTTRPWWRRG